MSDSVIAILFLGFIAGGGIIVIDYFVLRRIRRQAKDQPEEPTDKSD